MKLPNQMVFATAISALKAVAGSLQIQVMQKGGDYFLMLIPGSGDAVDVGVSGHGFHRSLAHQATISADFVQSRFAISTN